MDKQTEKIKMWKKKEEQLEAELESVMKQRGEAAAMGDLRENAAYQSLTEEAEVISARLAGIQKMVKKLENGQQAA